jgi:hypothetical protein
MGYLHRIGLPPRTVQICIRCRENPAGFWVSGHITSVTRRPWCLSCCQHLDRNRCAIAPFASSGRARPAPRLAGPGYRPR